MYARIISYVPSIARRERLNVGIVVVGDEGVHVELLDSPERLRCVDPAFDPAHLCRRLEGLALDLVDLPSLERMMARIDPTFEFSPPLTPTTSGIPVATMARSLFDRLVSFTEVAEASPRRSPPKHHADKGNSFLRDVHCQVTGKRGGARPWERNVRLDDATADRLFAVSNPPPTPRPMKMSLCVPNCNKVMVIEPLVKSWIDGSEAFAAAALFDYLRVMQPLTNKAIDCVVLLLEAAEQVDTKMVDLATQLCLDHKATVIRSDEKSQIDWLATRLKEYWTHPGDLL